MSCNGVDDGMSWSESGKPLDRFDTIYADQALLLARAVDFFGRRAQIRKVAEELRELADECDRAANGVSNEEALALERADVAIMLHQFDHLLLPSLRPLVRMKINSQLKRLEGRIEG